MRGPPQPQPRRASPLLRAAQPAAARNFPADAEDLHPRRTGFGIAPFAAQPPLTAYPRNAYAPHSRLE